MHLERNAEGILYFRQPMGLEDFVTWHMYPTGEAILRRDDIYEGRCLPPILYSELRLGGHLYTNRSGTYLPPFPIAAREVQPSRARSGSVPPTVLSRHKAADPREEAGRRSCFGWLMLFVGLVGTAMLGYRATSKSRGHSRVP